MNIQWPENPVRDKNNNKQPLLMEGRIKPNQISNTTMETYARRANKVWIVIRTLQ
ncbi:hypothetical protein ABID31_003861 [Chryseobacterium flavum]|uniref:hypothetical protein n=1 Tax=Chryseobacterium flavum TaxID=415851 RepID=UPI001300854D|nr:hypothetical protein [Chryseobacterium flavum]